MEMEKIISYNDALQLQAGDEIVVYVEDMQHKLSIKKGIARIFDTSVGIIISCYPNITSTGSVRGMKERGWWGKKDKTVRLGGYIYNVSSIVGSCKWAALCEKLSTAHQK